MPGVPLKNYGNLKYRLHLLLIFSVFLFWFIIYFLGRYTFSCCFLCVFSISEFFFFNKHSMLITDSFLATAKEAFLITFFLISLRPHALRLLHFLVRVRRTRPASVKRNHLRNLLIGLLKDLKHFLHCLARYEVLLLHGISLSSTLFLPMNPEWSALSQWIFEGDIKACFDKLSQDWLVDNIPMNKCILSKFFKAGFMEKKRVHPTEECAPQGGLCEENGYKFYWIRRQFCKLLCIMTYFA